MLSDVQINQQAVRRPIQEIAKELGLGDDDYEQYGKLKAKLTYQGIERIMRGVDHGRRGKLILVSAITPTTAGEGKTTTSIGLAQALRKTGAKAIAALREPSMGPVFGQKGGGTGGGYSQLVPMEDINLHFTGDIHAIAAANNLLAAMIDNQLHFANPLSIEPRAITFRRAMDINDRGLREIIQGIGGKANGVMRSAGFNITAASEVMAVLGLSSSISDLKDRLGNICVGKTTKGMPVFARDIQAHKGMAIILKDALRPNIVQTIDGTPALVHCGPFANIAHGASSILSTRLALLLGEYVVTEGGFGADLGLEKYMDIVCRCDDTARNTLDLVPDAVVLVATVKALKLHGGADSADLRAPNVEQLQKGLDNLTRHIRSVQRFGVPTMVAINHFYTDSEQEISAIKDHCRALGVECSIAEVFAKGGDGGLDLAKKVQSLASGPRDTSQYSPAYDLNDDLETKLTKIVQRVYGGRDVQFGADALTMRKWLEKHGFGRLPVCVAKTQYSFSDDASKLNAPSDFTITVRELRLSSGAGFIVAVTGEIMTMPGLPKEPSAVRMDIDDNGNITHFY